MVLKWHCKLSTWHELTIHHVFWWCVLMCHLWDSKQYCSSMDVQYMNMVAVNINYIHMHPSNGCMQNCDGFFLNVRGNKQMLLRNEIRNHKDEKLCLSLTYIRNVNNFQWAWDTFQWTPQFCSFSWTGERTFFFFQYLVNMNKSMYLTLFIIFFLFLFLFYNVCLNSLITHLDILSLWLDYKEKCVFKV